MSSIGFLRRSFMGIWVMIICHSVFSQNLVNKAYTFDDGLPSSHVYCVEQDTLGYIWAITDYGVSRYNGETFTSFDKSSGFPDKGGFHIYKDKKNVLWFIPFNGNVCYYDGDTFKIPEGFTIEEFGPVSWMAEDSKGNLCFVTRTGMLVLLRPDGKIISKKISNEQASCIVENAEGLYLIQFINELKWVNMKTGEIGIIPRFYNNYSKVNYPRLKKLKNGRVLFTSSEGIFEIGANLMLKKIMSLDDNLGSNNEIFNIYEDGDGSIWMPSREGLIKADATLNTKKIVKYFTGKMVFTVIKDSETNIWLATTWGLVKVLSEGAYYYSEADGLVSQNIRQLCNGEGEGVWAINFEGRIFNINNKVSELTKAPSAVMSDAVSLKKLDHNKLFINSFSLVSTFNLKTSEHTVLNLPLSPPSPIVYQCYKHDTLFFADLQGVGYFNSNKRVYSFVGTKENPIYTPVRCMEMDNEGSYWFGGRKGLFKITRNGVYTQMAKENPVCDIEVMQIQITSKNEIWVATASDVFYCIKNKKIIPFKLPLSFNTRIKNITLINDTVLWVATNNGALKFSVTQPQNLKLIYYYNVHNALLANDVNSIVENGNNVYFATNKGISVINQRLYALKKTQPKVLINHVSLGGINTQPFLVNNVEVDYKNNFLSLDVDAPAYSFGKIRYKYILHPLDTTWEQTTANTIKYSSLPPGKYVFRIKAVNVFGQESSHQQHFEFSIKKPFWLTVWFWVFVFIVFSAIVYFIVKRRLRKIRHESAIQRGLVEAQLKALRLQMNPHFIFNTLQSIQDYIITNQAKLAITYLSKFSKLVRKALDYSKHNFITLHEDIETLDLYVELETARYNGKLEFIKKIGSDIDTERVQIPPMLIQPFIENAIKHGVNATGGGVIELTVSKQKNFLCVEIKDNGIGREAANKKGALKAGHKSTGISQTTERLDMVFANYGLKGSSITITDLYENEKPIGTQVTIKIPYADG
jgi:ligand-binding sensor domain-containing protein/two-component sensor histidine kinase